MGVLEKLSRKTGVITGDDVLRLFEYAQEKNFAIPAVVSGTPLSPVLMSRQETNEAERHLLLRRRLYPRGCP